jgi:flagellar hook-associated protein 3 FlgL
MRITPGMTADSAVYNLQQMRQTLDTLQEQISSGLNVNRPSDDPLTTRQVMDLQNQLSVGDQYISNITKGSLLLNVTNTALSSMSQIMQQVKKIAGDALSGSTDNLTISGGVTNLTQLKAQLIDLGNTHIGDQYVFGGFSNSPPFDASGDFSGTDDEVRVEIAPSSQVSISVSGGDLLRGGIPPQPVGSGATAGQKPVDIIRSIDALVIAINSNDRSALADAVKNLAAASDQVNAATSDVAGRLVRLDNMKTMITSNQNTLKAVYGDLQNVDIAKAGIELSQQTTAFNAALATTAKITQLSLLDYLY